jgi:nicotinamide-nucleotide amidase
MDDKKIIAMLVENIKNICIKKNFMISTAESCTGGLLAGALTSLPGMSNVFERGFITYSNASKNEEISVPENLIKEKGAVSAEVARAMAEGTLQRSSTQLSIAITGIAGPGGAGDQKPIGRVHVAVAFQGKPTKDLKCDFGDIGREQVRMKSVIAALELAFDQLKANWAG